MRSTITQKQGYRNNDDCGDVGDTDDNYEVIIVETSFMHADYRDR